MDTRLALRRHLYEQRARARPASRLRRALGRQIAVVDRAAEGPDGDDDDDGGGAGVREPRRPAPDVGPERRTVDGA